MNMAMLVIAASAVVLPAVAAEDVEAVKAVVKSAYVDGVHAKPDAALMRAGFHPYLSLYRFPDSWKIVSKIFQAHPVS